MKNRAIMSGEVQTWGETSETMRALPNDRWRRFVENFVFGTPPNAAEAYRRAGLGLNSSTLDQARGAHKLLRDDRVAAAVAELSKKYWRAAVPSAVTAAIEIIEDRDHKDRAKVALSLINRVDPEITRSALEITTRRILSHDEEAIEELQAMRALRVPREEILRNFGEDGLARLEKIERRQLEHRADKARVIEGEVVEPAPGPPPDRSETPTAAGDPPDGFEGHSMEGRIDPSDTDSEDDLGSTF